MASSALFFLALKEFSLRKKYFRIDFGISVKYTISTLNYMISFPSLKSLKSHQSAYFNDSELN